jgi:glycine cleavage system H lipoate-binding protein
MKTRIQLIGLFLLFFGMISVGNNEKSQSSSANPNVVTINTPANLLGLANSLVCEYEKENHRQKFSVNQISPTIFHTPEAGSLSLFNDNQLQNIKGAQTWQTLIGRTIVVPVISDKNPYLNEVLQQGISPEKLKEVLRSSVKWENLLGGSPNEFVHVYTLNNQSVSSILANWLNGESFNAAQLNPLDLKELIQAVQNDPFAIGFCKLTQISDAENGSFLSGLKILPIDKNANGKIDYMENIYDNMQSFTRGVWIGKYPRELTSSVYVVTPEKPQGKSEIAFLKWILNNGQQELIQNDFSSLTYNEQVAQLARFDEPPLYASLPVEQTNTLMSALLLTLLVIVLGGLGFELVFRAFTTKNKKSQNAVVETVKAFNEAIVDVPKGIYFDKSHSWAFMRKNGLIKVGIDDFLQHVTGKITKVELKEPGIKIRKGDPLCSIVQKGKVLHLYSPVTGTLIEINEKLKTNASLLNTDPYSDGWIYMIEPVNWELEQQYLQIADRFKANLEHEFQRLKDFLNSTLKSVLPDFAYAVMQDGGSLVDHPLAELGPDVWDDFQTQFIDAVK